MTVLSPPQAPGTESSPLVEIAHILLTDGDFGEKVEVSVRKSWAAGVAHGGLNRKEHMSQPRCLAAWFGGLVASSRPWVLLILSCPKDHGQLALLLRTGQLADPEQRTALPWSSLYVSFKEQERRMLARRVPVPEAALH